MRPQREAATKQRSHFGVLSGLEMAHLNSRASAAPQAGQRCWPQEGCIANRNASQIKIFVGPFPTMNNDAMDPVRITGAPAERRGSAF